MLIRGSPLDRAQGICLFVAPHWTNPTTYNCHKLLHALCLGSRSTKLGREAELTAAAAVARCRMRTSTINNSIVHSDEYSRPTDEYSKP
jgi:hypothetical protein